MTKLVVYGGGVSAIVGKTLFDDYSPATVALVLSLLVGGLFLGMFLRRILFDRVPERGLASDPRPIRAPSSSELFPRRGR